MNLRISPPRTSPGETADFAPAGFNGFLDYRAKLVSSLETLVDARKNAASLQTTIAGFPAPGAPRDALLTQLVGNQQAALRAFDSKWEKDPTLRKAVEYFTNLLHTK